ncbi:MAG: hypothetical protein GY822_11045, partial [Deltaproteobacteria bacterium]|nr:hypothetical protein [Deltaproteobacteria bacterium]
KTIAGAMTTEDLVKTIAGAMTTEDLVKIIAGATTTEGLVKTIAGATTTADLVKTIAGATTTADLAKTIAGASRSGNLTRTETITGVPLRVAKAREDVNGPLVKETNAELSSLRNETHSQRGTKYARFSLRERGTIVLTLVRTPCSLQ